MSTFKLHQVKQKWQYTRVERIKLKDQKVVKLFLFLKNRIKSRVWIDLKFYKMMKDLTFFFQISGVIMMQFVLL